MRVCCVRCDVDVLCEHGMLCEGVLCVRVM